MDETGRLRKLYLDVVWALDSVRVIRYLKCKLGLHLPAVEWEAQGDWGLGEGEWVETGFAICDYCQKRLGLYVDTK